MKVAVVGAGFSGAAVAYELGRAGHQVHVYEVRDHVAGNCHTVRDEATGVMRHVYGPHIFHTDDDEIWQFVNRFSDFRPYVNRVKAIARGNVYTLPINLLTINQFFGKVLRPQEAKEFLSNVADRSIAEPRNFEEQALKLIGKELYEAFFRGYTRKQWGMEPNRIPASVLKRLPVRFNYDDNYYAHRYQGIPVDGYTAVVQRMLDESGATLTLGTAFPRNEAGAFDHVFYTGPIDAWFDYRYGRLAYRTLDFDLIREDGDFQGNAVINYCDEEVEYTRIAEHKHFAPWEEHPGTLCSVEFSRFCEPGDVPYYPIRLADDKTLLKSYLEAAHDEQGVTFLGRLGTYRYLDMDVTIREALDVGRRYLAVLEEGQAMPSLVHAVP